MLQISEVLYQSTQGMAAPFICMADDGLRYYVKGRDYCGRESQLCEYFGWHLANAFGLPVPSAVMMELCEDLFEELPSDLRKIGPGMLFGIQDASPARWLEEADIQGVPKSLRRDLLVFDYWVCNEDRGASNSNLLLNDQEKSVIVIDHNRTFCMDRTAQELIEDHIFVDEWQYLRSDLVAQAEYSARLAEALPAWGHACDNLPPAWRWANDACDIPVRFDWQRAREMLHRFNERIFWEAV